MDHLHRKRLINIWPTCTNTAPNAKVKIGRMSDFYNSIIKENPQLPIVKGDMPDTWIHGFMSMPREVKDSRRINRDLFSLGISKYPV